MALSDSAQRQGSAGPWHKVFAGWPRSKYFMSWSRMYPIVGQTISCYLRGFIHLTLLTFFILSIMFSRIKFLTGNSTIDSGTIKWVVWLFL